MMRKVFKTVGISLIAILLCSQCKPESTSVIYVATDGKDENSGFQGSPVSSIAQALTLADEYGASEIMLGAGRYDLSEKLTITSDSLKIGGEGATISGGVEVKNFEKLEGNLYVADVSHLLTREYDNLRQLFKDGERMPRAQTPNGDEYFLTAGQVEKYKDSVRAWDFAANARNQIENPEINTTFSFNSGDIKAGWDEPYVEVKVHHSWESCWQTIRKIDTVKNEIWMNTPSVWPVNFFGSHGDKLRYKLYNHKDFIDQPGEWMVDPGKKKLYYLAVDGEDIDKALFVLPTVPKMIQIKDSKSVTFENLTFAYSDYLMNIYSPGVHPWEDTVYSPTWAKHAQSLYADWPKKFYPGYSEPQAAINSGEAIEISDSENITFKNCTFRNMGANAIWIHENASYVNISNSTFDDTGAGAVKMGTPKNDIIYWKLEEEDMTHHNRLQNCVIKNGGKVFAGCIGIWIGQSYDNVIQSNEIFNYPYSGISLGWNWNTAPNYTKRNLILNNKIHDVLQVLTDGGGIYTLGNLEGTIIQGNEIYDIYRSENAAGSNSNGIFFDQDTEGVVMRSNYIHNILNSPIRFNNTHHERQKEISNNYFDVKYLRAKYNNNYNTDFDENGFARFKIENNNYGVEDGMEWKKSLERLK